MDKKDPRKIVRFSWEQLILFCEWEECTISFTTMESFVSHIKKEHFQDNLLNLFELDLQCYWKDCDHVSKSLSELKLHVYYHAFHTKIKCLGKNFQDRKKLANCLMGNHTRNFIPELLEPFICNWDECRDVFESPDCFYNHVKAHCVSSSYEQTVINDAKLISCKWANCKGKFTDQYKLKDHINSHTQEKLIACPTCGGMFANRTKFSDHLTRQKPIKKDTAYVCEYCGSLWGSDRLLRDHMLHHINHYKCPYCDMTCPTPSALQEHIQYRHSDVKPHACQYCDYKCKKKNDLRKHLLIHSDDPPFVCNEDGCNFSCRVPGIYRNHLLTQHRNMKPKQYSCHLCSKITMRGNYLTQHLIKKHNLCWPSGHYRFRYRQHSDSYYRLETVRYESSELSEAVLCDSEKLDDPVDPTSLHSNTDLLQKVSNATCTSMSNEESTCLPNPSVIMYMPNSSTNESVMLSNLTEQREVSILETDSNRQKPVILQIVDSDGNPVTFSENSILFSQTVDQLPSFCNSQELQVVKHDENGKIQYQTAHVIAENSFS